MRSRPSLFEAVLALVLSFALLGAGASDAVASKKRYTVTISFNGVQDYVWWLTSGAWDATEHRVTRWVARSSLFVLRRWDLDSRSRFHFDTRVSGELSHIGRTEFVNGSCPGAFFAPLRGNARVTIMDPSRRDAMIALADQALVRIRARRLALGTADHLTISILWPVGPGGDCSTLVSVDLAESEPATAMERGAEARRRPSCDDVAIRRDGCCWRGCARRGCP